MYFCGTITPQYPGIKSIPCGFQPTGMRITVSAKSGTDNADHRSVGVVDNSGWMTYDSTYSDSSDHRSFKGIDKIVSHYERVSGVLREVNAATFDSFTSTGAKFNVTKADQVYQYTVEVWN